MSENLRFSDVFSGYKNEMSFNFIKKEALAQVFYCEFCEISKNTCFQRRPLVAAAKYSEFKTRQELFQAAFSCFEQFETLSSCDILISIRHRCFFVSFTKLLKTLGDFS